jgi:hypothetical protein
VRRSAYEVALLTVPERQSGEASPTLAAPHFVGIGAPRCGTTWVYAMLRLHPQVWIPWKEIHFFDSIDQEIDSGYDIRSRAFRLKTGWRYALPRLAASIVPGVSAVARRFFPLKAVPAPGCRWTARYLFGEATLRWYQDLFREGARANLRCGEITPAYFMLSAHGIDAFARALPEVRVFLLLRDPLEWAWSDLCRKLRVAGQRPSDLSDEALIARCAVPDGRSRADFGLNVSRWLGYFPRERMFIGFHEEIRTEPAAFSDRLCEFVAIDPFPAALCGLFRERINSSARGYPMPPAVMRYAAERYRSEAETMARLLGGPAERWLIRIDRELEGRRQ